MSRPKRQPASQARRTEHRDVAEGRGPTLDLASAVAIEAANRAVGFDPPPAAQDVIDGAEPAELEAARKLVAAASIVVDTPTDPAEGGELSPGQDTPKE